MDSKYEDFNDVINNVTVDMPKTKFELNQLKLEHYYLADGDVNFGMPISTSIELVSKLDYETQKNVWEKIVIHTYINLDNNKSTVFYKQNIDEKIIKQIEQYDLRELKNNYFSDSEPENFSYWSIT